MTHSPRKRPSTPVSDPTARRHSTASTPIPTWPTHDPVHKRRRRSTATSTDSRVCRSSHLSPRRRFAFFDFCRSCTTCISQPSIALGVPPRLRGVRGGSNDHPIAYATLGSPERTRRLFEPENQVCGQPADSPSRAATPAPTRIGKPKRLAVLAVRPKGGRDHNRPAGYRSFRPKAPGKPGSVPCSRAPSITKTPSCQRARSTRPATAPIRHSIHAYSICQERKTAEFSDRKPTLLQNSPR